MGMEEPLNLPSYGRNPFLLNQKSWERRFGE